MIQVRELVKRRPVVTVEKSATVQAAVEVMARDNVGALAVMDAGLLVGVLVPRKTYTCRHVLSSRSHPCPACSERSSPSPGRSTQRLYSSFDDRCRRGQPTIFWAARMTVSIAVTNQKGGVAKTTTAVSLASALARLGAQVLLVDQDPQANATSALGFGKDSQTSLHGVLLHDLPAEAAILQTAVPRLSLLPSSLEMASAEVELVPVMAREFRLRASLARLAGYDMILIDCPPSLGLLTLNALVAADHVIVPVQCEYLALEGLAQLISTIEAVRARLNPSLSILAILLTMEDRRNRLSMQVADEVIRHFPDLVATTRIPRSVRLAEAPSHGKPIDVYDPSSRATEAYAQFALEVRSRLDKALTGAAAS